MPGSWVRQTWRFDPTLDAPPKYRRACHYDAFFPDRLADLPLSFNATLLGLISDAEGAIRELNETGGGALAPLGRLLLRTESIASSKVEGMQLGVREMARAEAEADTGGRPSATALEVLANVDAMELAVGAAAEAPVFTLDEIIAIHTRLMQRASNAHLAGRVRTQQNWIGGNDYNPCGADFVPPPPETVNDLLADLCAAVNDDVLPPLVQAALVHAQFETIHPFEDGNGRTGRALVHVIFRRRGLAPRFLPPISVVLAAARDRYIAGLTAFRADRVDAWVEHFAAATLRAARLARAYLGAVEALREGWRTRVRGFSQVPRADSAVWRLIDVLPAHPVITGPVAAAATGAVKTTAYTAIDQLVSAGVLLPLSPHRRNRVWEASGLLALIAQLEAGQLP